MRFNLFVRSYWKKTIYISVYERCINNSQKKSFTKLPEAYGSVALALVKAPTLESCQPPTKTN